MPASRDRTLWPVTLQLREDQRAWLLERTSGMKGYSALVRDLIDREMFKTR